jgi:hypothetical protein
MLLPAPPPVSPRAVSEWDRPDALGSGLASVTAVEVADESGPIVILRGADPAEGTGGCELLLRLDRVVTCGRTFGLVLDLDGTARRAGPLVEAALARHRARLAECCVGAVTVVPAGVPRRPLVDHPVLFPFPSASVSSLPDALAWVWQRLRDVGSSRTGPAATRPE